LFCAAITRIERLLLVLNIPSNSIASNTAVENEIYARIESNSAALPPILIICPASLTFHWVDEIEKFFDFSQTELSGLPCNRLKFGAVLCDKEFFKDIRSPSANNKNHLLSNYNVFIVSYDFFRQESSFFLSILWELVILDEAHLIRNPNIQITKLIFQLRSFSRLPLTGTPLQNHVEDIWSLMNFLLPDYLNDFQHFSKNFIKPIKKSMEVMKIMEIHQSSSGNSTGKSDINGKEYKKQSKISVKGLELLHHLHQQILPFLLRRSKSEVLKELPSKTVVNILCPLSNLQKKLYSDLLKNYQKNEQDLVRELGEAKGGKFNTSEVEEKEKKSNQVFDTNSDNQLQEENRELYEKVLSKGTNSTSSKKSNVFQFQLLSSASSELALTSQATNYNPLQLVSYLQSVCFHPLTVINPSLHKIYYENQSKQLDVSGKFLQLMKLLMEVEILDENDYLPRNGKRGKEDNYRSFGEFKNLVFVLSEGTDSFSRNAEDSQAVEIDEVDDDEESVSSSDTTPTTKDVKDAKAVKTATKEKDEANTTKENSTSNPLSVSRKCLIFTKFHQSLDFLEKFIFRKYFPGVKYGRLDGTVPPKERFRIAKQFNQKMTNTTKNVVDENEIPLFPTCVYQELEDKEKKVSSEIDNGELEEMRILLMTTKSCGLGLNLTSADTVVFLEHDWNPFIDLQAMDRVHRIGQENPVMVYRLVADSPIENRVLSFQDAKTDLAREVRIIVVLFSFYFYLNVRLLLEDLINSENKRK
jgi:SNF2 family DNA or RNA helicase